MAGDNFNYALRPNKAVERKIVFNSLLRLGKLFDFKNYMYVGLGSLWFVDFILAHKIVGIPSLTSIERKEIKAARASFNRPFGCVDVVHGDTSGVLPKLKFSEKPALIWLDYTDSIRIEILRDISLLVERCTSNSIILLTVNAEFSSLPEFGAEDQKLEPEDSLRQIAGDAVPNDIPAKRFRRSDYPKLVGEVLVNHFERAVIASGRGHKFIKLFDIVYADGQLMVTIGGIITAPEAVADVGKILEAGWEGIIADQINVPALTIKEKLALDQILPSPTPPTAADISALGFLLNSSEAEAYFRYYKYYPSYGEISI